MNQIFTELSKRVDENELIRILNAASRDLMAWDNPESQALHDKIEQLMYDMLPGE